METLKIIVTMLTMVSAFYSYSQNISGSVKFQSDRTDYSLVFVECNGVKTECDSLGEFELNSIGGNDTLEITPIPIFVNVKIYNFSSSADSLQFESIPLFQNIEQGIPIINFKSKRASRKYFKQLEKERELEKQELIKRISYYSYEWSGRVFKLEVVDSEESLTILINLNQ